MRLAGPERRLKRGWREGERIQFNSDKQGPHRVKCNRPYWNADSMCLVGTTAMTAVQPLSPSSCFSKDLPTTRIHSPALTTFYFQKGLPQEFAGQRSYVPVSRKVYRRGSKQFVVYIQSLTMHVSVNDQSDRWCYQT